MAKQKAYKSMCINTHRYERWINTQLCNSGKMQTLYAFYNGIRNPPPLPLPTLKGFEGT